MASQRVRHNQVTFTFTSLFNHSISSQQSASIGSSSQVSISNKGQMTFAHVSLEGKLELREHRFVVFFFFILDSKHIFLLFQTELLFLYFRRQHIYTVKHIYIYESESVSHSVMCNSLQFHALQHTRLPRPSLSPRVW